MTTSLKTPILTGAAALIALGVGYAAAPRGGETVSPRERGHYLVETTGCADCHTPMKMGPAGPAPDPARLLAGHPAGMEIPPAPAADGPWLVSGTATNTAWAGPWGVSFSTNLTPDRATGLGGWTAGEFVAAMRTGRHRGNGRAILPPMPWAALANMTDDDLHAIFAYLQSIPPVANPVPDPLPPAQR